MLDAGWAYDEITAAFTDSTDSPYALSLAGPAWFRITDYFTAGDQYFVYDGGSLILTTSAYVGGPLPAPSSALGDAGWAGGSFQKGEIMLAAGSHTLTVQGDGTGGVPAGFYTRLDSPVSTVPVPPAGLAGLFFLGGLIVVRTVRRRGRADS